MFSMFLCGSSLNEISKKFSFEAVRSQNGFGTEVKEISITNYKDFLEFGRQNRDEFFSKVEKIGCSAKSDETANKMELKIGDVFSASKQITDSVVRAFAELSGDYNPIHLDEEFAKTTRFGRRIAHGMISGALISAVLGYELKDRKIVYLSQTLKFTAPVFIDDTVTATATVTSIREDKPIVTIETVCTKQSGETVVQGEAAIMILD